MAGLETGPGLLPQQVIERQKVILKIGEIIPTGKRDFTNRATFIVEANDAPARTTFFCPYLLNYDPNLYGLRISRYATVLLLDRNDQLQRAPILSQDLRMVDLDNSGKGIVGESGYVLQRYFRLSGKRITKRRLDRILGEADQGIKPPAFSEDSFIKVDKDLAGQTLLVLTIDPGPYRPDLNQDAVVIDPESRKLVEREVTKPLSLQRWSQLPLTADQLRQITWLYPT